MQLRKGESTGRRAAAPPPEPTSWLTHAGIDDCRATAKRAEMGELVAAYKYCLGQPTGNKTRKTVILGALRRRFNIRLGCDLLRAIGEKGGAQ